MKKEQERLARWRLELEMLIIRLCSLEVVGRLTLSRIPVIGVRRILVELYRKAEVIITWSTADIV